MLFQFINGHNICLFDRKWEKSQFFFFIDRHTLSPYNFDFLGDNDDVRQQVISLFTKKKKNLPPKWTTLSSLSLSLVEILIRKIVVDKVVNFYFYFGRFFLFFLFLQKSSGFELWKIYAIICVFCDPLSKFNFFAKAAKKEKKRAYGVVTQQIRKKGLVTFTTDCDRRPKAFSLSLVNKK